jgi:PleD family two-component response regulator
MKTSLDHTKEAALQAALAGYKRRCLLRRPDLDCLRAISTVKFAAEVVSREVQADAAGGRCSAVVGDLGGTTITEGTENAPVVFVVDDDASVREVLDSLFRPIDLQVETFAAAEEFLQRKLPDAPSCLVLDVRLPGLGGLDLQAELAKLEIYIPTLLSQRLLDDRG